jgi:hydrogenase maturation factor
VIETPACTDPHHCITCGDVAVEMTVLRIDEARELALCEGVDGTRSAVEIALIPEVRPADCLLVHAGTAIQRITEAVC